MTILICLAVGMVLGAAVVYFADDCEWCGVLGVVLALLCGMGLLVAGIALLEEHHRTSAEIAAFHQVRASVEAARERGDIESTALALKIIEVNSWLVKKQYWNGTCFDLWIPDEVDELEPIR